MYPSIRKAYFHFLGATSRDDVDVNDFDLTMHASQLMSMTFCDSPEAHRHAHEETPELHIYFFMTDEKCQLNVCRLCDALSACDPPLIPIALLKRYGILIATRTKPKVGFHLKFFINFRYNIDLAQMSRQEALEIVCKWTRNLEVKSNERTVPAIELTCFFLAPPPKSMYQSFMVYLGMVMVIQSQALAYLQVPRGGCWACDLKNPLICIDGNFPLSQIFPEFETWCFNDKDPRMFLSSTRSSS
ncbi:hypothetical protein DM01DRAFT_1334450 [Hesseltinella vesiculosa]|uniref:Uncharacterized protein n=1 Tax=Hesseltinella vesiculosa TaxID=101127 RepID=A0A1X2GM18_9FUNG|nr:hypothetical protein DM01DRAFT_1334450 [Hesseltinella vesiculosa]